MRFRKRQASPTPVDERSQGLLSKYDVRRRNDPEGKHADCWYFMLDPEHDPLAREALAAYARAARREGYGVLASDLRVRLSKWLDRRPCGCQAHPPGEGCICGGCWACQGLHV